MFLLISIIISLNLSHSRRLCRGIRITKKAEEGEALKEIVGLRTSSNEMKE